MNNQNSNPKCNDCGGELILMEITTSQSGNNPSLITKTTYRCSNKECQDECDKRTAKKEELRKEQELARQNRAAAHHKSITLKPHPAQ